VSGPGRKVRYSTARKLGPKGRGPAFGVEGRNMLAAIGNTGIVGIVVVVLIVLAVLYFVRRA
jgi:hypothetical protein